MKPSVLLPGVVLFAAVTGSSVFAAAPNVEASMVITGTITVDPDGSVKNHTLHDQDKVPPGVVQIVERTIHRWRFVPVVEEGKPIVAQAGMAIRVVADMVDKEHATLRVAGVSFGCDAYQAEKLLPNACPPNTTVTPRQRQPPLYPIEALRRHLAGEVYLAVEVGRDGRVTRADATQVNLFNRIRDGVRFENVFAENAREAAMKWQFAVPSTGPEAARDHWIVMVPIVYTIDGPRREHYGKWRAYVPGSQRDVPWASGEATGSADAFSDGGAPFVRDSRFVLKTGQGTDRDRS